LWQSDSASTVLHSTAVKCCALPAVKSARTTPFYPAPTRPPSDSIQCRSECGIAYAVCDGLDASLTVVYKWVCANFARATCTKPILHGNLGHAGNATSFTAKTYFAVTFSELKTAGAHTDPPEIMAEADEKRERAGCWAAMEAQIHSFQETVAASAHIVVGNHTIAGLDQDGSRRSPVTMWKLMLCQYFSHLAFLVLLGLVFFAWLAVGVGLIYAALKEDKGTETSKIILIVWSFSVPFMCAPLVVKTRRTASQAAEPTALETITTS